MTTAVHKSRGSDAVTEGIRVTVDPSFDELQSDPERERFIFAYRVRMTNEGTEAASLKSRSWRVVDADGTSHEGEGPGVVGQYPQLAPGESFEYSSFCPLPTSWGTMEGHFVFVRPDESTFHARVARFFFATNGVR